MSRKGREAAQQHGEKLPAFDSATEAEEYYFSWRDEHLASLSGAASKHLSFETNYSPESLKQLEQWYFQLYESDSFSAAGSDRESFETSMAMYFGETAVRSAGAQWIVEPYFLAPNKYEFGVSKGSFKMMLSSFMDHYGTPNNKRRDSLFRRYKKYFGRDT